MSKSTWICENCYLRFTWMSQLGFLSTELVPVIFGAWPLIEQEG